MACVLSWALPVRADGAFPDELQIFLPPDQPHRILVTTNFGLLESNDDGQSWRWVCEQVVTSSQTAQTYQVGPPPEHTIYAAVLTGLTVSHDDACSFDRAGGILDGAFTTDVFADPIDPMHALVVATPVSDGGSVPSGLYETHDAGRSFAATPIFAPGGGLQLNGVEIAAMGTPQPIYATLKHTEPLHPYLARSGDGGATWQTFDLQPSVGALEVRLAAVDPQNPEKVYLRVMDPVNGDKLAITTDGGMTVTTPLALSTQMSSFLRRADGTLLVGTRAAIGKRSTDGGQTFSDWPGAPHLRALGERGGDLYACGDNWMDNFIVGVSHDGGMTWQPLLRFDQICGPKTCPNVQSTCAMPWQGLVDMFAIPPTVCGGTPAMTPPPSGCGCRVGGRGEPALALLLVSLVVSSRCIRRCRAWRNRAGGRPRGSRAPRRTAARRD